MRTLTVLNKKQLSAFNRLILLKSLLWAPLLPVFIDPLIEKKQTSLLFIQSANCIDKYKLLVCSLEAVTTRFSLSGRSLRSIRQSSPS